MPSSIPPLHAVPADPTPDSGPRHQGGTLVLLAALMATLTVLFAVGLCLQFDRPSFIAPAVILFGVPAAWWWWCVCQAARPRPAPPRSHRVLAGVLGFEVICSCRGVAPTVFFHPDRSTAGADLCLLVFLENYTSRQRIVEVRAGPHPGLGLAVAQSVRLHLSAGQAAVYRWPLRSLPSLAAGSHDLPVVLRVQRPQGAGEWLTGVRRHLYNIWHTRFAVPFTIDASAGTAATGPLPASSYFTLASVSGDEPRPDSLANLLGPS